MTKLLYDLMRKRGLYPVPVFHYGEDVGAMDYYIDKGAKTIALGNTVWVKDKGVVARWCDEIHERYPNVSLHLLGSSSSKILQSGSLSSCDSCSWYRMAINGKPKSIQGTSREAKMERAEANMLKIMEVFNESPVPVNDSSIEHCNSEIQSVCPL